MTLQEINYLANSIRKHGNDRDVLAADIAARFVPEAFRKSFVQRATGKVQP